MWDMSGVKDFSFSWPGKHDWRRETMFNFNMLGLTLNSKTEKGVK